MAPEIFFKFYCQLFEKQSKPQLRAKDNCCISVSCEAVDLQVLVSTSNPDKCLLWNEGLSKNNKKTIPCFQNVFDLVCLSRQGLNF